MAPSLFWYDIETFGKDPQLDRIAQFAGIRTDDRFEPLEEPIVQYVSPAPDYVPNPQACFVTGITPQEALKKGQPEYELAERIFKEWTRPGTCVLGFNNIKFDDEFMRNLFYRNLFDPYVREYAGNNSRWDLINVMRAARDLRPEGINWPSRDDGKTGFRLEELCAANGIEHQNAHDALSDVRATISLAKLLHEKQPKLFKFLFAHRSKQKISSLIDLQHRKPLLYTSGIFSRPEGSTTVVVPVTVDPRNRNAVLAIDLRYDPRPVIDLSVERIRARLFVPKEERDEERIPLTAIPINKSPVLAPLKTLDPSAAKRLGIDLEQVERHRQLLLRAPNLTEKVREVFLQPEGGGEPDDVDLAIYSGGFFLDEDRTLFEEIHRRGVSTWREYSGRFTDSRADKLLHRLVGRNYPQYFNEGEQKRWKSFCATRLLFPPGGRVDNFGTFEKKLKTYSRSTDLSPREKLIVRELMDYRDYLRETVLAYH